jgi:hypothetical protein
LLGGAVVGGLIGYAAYQEPKDCGEFGFDCFGEDRGTHTLQGAAVGGLVGLIFGGVLGVSTGAKDTYYDFSEKTSQQKVAIIESILSK